MSLRVGLLNMMADKAFVVSERHFATLLGREAGRELTLVRVTFGAVARSGPASAHIRQYYRDADSLRPGEIDVLVITGANVSDPHLPGQVFWQPLVQLLDWARANDVPTLCSCLATHAVLEALHGQRRRPVQPKVWGVYRHRHGRPGHPLLRGLAAEVPVPHSRHNEVTADQLAVAGYEVLLASEQAGVHLAVQRDGGRWLLLQGHPEYEAISLLKEYKREVGRWQAGDRLDYPPLPHGYVAPPGRIVLAAYRARCLARGAGAAGYDPFPEPEVARGLPNSWTSPAVAVIDNWLATLGHK